MSVLNNQMNFGTIFLRYRVACEVWRGSGEGQELGFGHVNPKRNDTQMDIWASLVAQTLKNLPAMQDTEVRSLDG